MKEDSSRTVRLDVDDVVLFSSSELNVGDGLNAATSVFTCPTAGVYEFR